LTFFVETHLFKLKHQLFIIVVNICFVIPLEYFPYNVEGEMKDVRILWQLVYIENKWSSLNIFILCSILTKKYSNFELKIKFIIMQTNIS